MGSISDTVTSFSLGPLRDVVVFVPALSHLETEARYDRILTAEKDVKAA